MTRPGATGGCALLLLVAVIAPSPTAGQAQLSFAADRASSVLDVPFVPQSPALCGGAAIAMVLRYWGERGVYADEFAALVVESGEGIRTDDLADAVRQRGWQAVPFAGEAGVVQWHLRRGRPVIALIEDRPGRYHYVVVVAWHDGTVALHDPARGPLRQLAETRFERAWQTTGRWAMLVLPESAGSSGSAREPAGERVDELGAGVESDSTAVCSALLDAAVLSARGGEFEAAERALLEAGTMCADAAAVTIELAAVHFRQQRYAEAARLAAAALDGSAQQAAGWDLLASSLYLLDDHEGALRAWNRIGRPRNDLTRIDDLRSMPFPAVSRAVGIAPRALVTSAALARARRRVAALPTVLRARVDYRPVRGGDVEVQAAVVERPLLPLSVADLIAHGVRALADSRVKIDVSNAVGTGEVWLVDWVWKRNRRAVELGLAAPNAFGARGVWQLRASDRMLTYRLRAETPPVGEEAPVRRETHRTATLRLSDWVSGAVRWQISASADSWSERGGFAGLAAELQLRGWRDRGALRLARGGWWALGRNDQFYSLELQAAFRSASDAAPLVWSVRGGIALASDSAPRSQWAGAGTDFGARALLRAHQLVDSDGIIDGAFFGPRLVHAGLELQRWLLRLGPLQLGLAAFADGASVRPVADYVAARTALDVGAGVRARVPGLSGAVRADAALGLTDGASALSLGWAPAWPSW